MDYVGQNGQIKLLDDELVIRRKGLGVFFSQSLKHEKSIPYSSISAVQYKPAGMSIVDISNFWSTGSRAQPALWM